ncbi:hypothetical protein O1L68_00110 [Streptomyces lydicus]|nr:hypothetical protein [Streptomyces lydicus]
MTTPLSPTSPRPPSTTWSRSPKPGAPAPTPGPRSSAKTPSSSSPPNPPSAPSDSGPADWKPANHAFWCTYAEEYTHVKSVFKLTTTDSEKTALASMLDTCTN